MGPLLSHLAFDRIQRARLIATYTVGMIVGAALAAGILALIGAPLTL
jgi:hypothetical protein